MDIFVTQCTVTSGGKYTTGASCLYIKRLSDIDMDVLRELVAKTYAHMQATNG